MTEDLAAWLLEQIAVDERMATATAGEAGGTDWTTLECPQCWGHVATVAEAAKKWPDCIVECYPNEGGGLSCPVHGFIAEWDPARVLAECDAKRRIVELHHPTEWLAWDPACQLDVPDSGPPCDTLRLLALPYSNRPGYRAEWRP